MRLLRLQEPIDPVALASLRDGGLRLYRAVDGALSYAWPETGDVGLPLTPTLTVDGASIGEPAPFRYVVETDVLPEHEADFNAWYAEEHLPGLAAVPGVVRARQFTVEGGGPRYHSVYDLAVLEAFNSPPWLAVRGTAWSSRVRPAFRNTIRTMFAAT